MLRKFVPVLALLAVPAIASAQFEAGDFELTLAGNASAPKDVEGGYVGVNASLGYFLTKELEGGIRQSVSYLQNDEKAPNVDDTGWGGSTVGFANFHLDLGAFQPYVGAFGGYDYTEFLDGQAVVGPEVGVKYFVNGTTFVFASLDYVYLLSDPSFSFFSGTAGVGFRF